MIKDFEHCYRNKAEMDHACPNCGGELVARPKRLPKRTAP